MDKILNPKFYGIAGLILALLSILSGLESQTAVSFSFATVGAGFLIGAAVLQAGNKLNES